MQACVLHAVGDLRCEDVETPSPRPGEVLVKVMACGVCGSDVPRVFEKGTYKFPTIPGHEFAGEVVAVGAGDDEDLIGERVTVFPLIPCRNCPACEIGAFAQCEDYDYLGSRSNGAFAEYVCAPIWNLVRIPDGVSWSAAALSEPAAVAVHALNRAGIVAGDTVLIFGAGPIGLLVAMWARVCGAGQLLLTDVDGKKLQFAKQLGFEDGFNPSRGDVVRWASATTGRGADIVVEASGSSTAFEKAMLAPRRFGKIVLLGNPAGEMTLPPEAYGMVLRRELQLFGSWNSSYSVLPHNDWELALKYMNSGAIKAESVITHEVELAELPDALVMLRDRTEFVNKVMYLAPQLELEGE